MPKPKKYMDPKAYKASVAEMAREMALRKKEVAQCYCHFSGILIFKIVLTSSLSSYLSGKMTGVGVAVEVKHLHENSIWFDTFQQQAAKTLKTGDEMKAEPRHDVETLWVEAKTEGGDKYYFHMYSGGTFNLQRRLSVVMNKKACLLFFM